MKIPEGEIGAGIALGRLGSLAGWHLVWPPVWAQTCPQPPLAGGGENVEGHRMQGSILMHCNYGSTCAKYL
jgi:hypothetical protein